MPYITRDNADIAGRRAGVVGRGAVDLASALINVAHVKFRQRSNLHTHVTS